MKKLRKKKISILRGEKNNAISNCRKWLVSLLSDYNFTVDKISGNRYKI